MDTLKDAVVLKALEDAPICGWSMTTIKRATQSLGTPSMMGDALFPDGIMDATRHVTDLFDRRLAAKLKATKPDAMRVRERIAHAVMTRLELMTPYKAGLHVVFAAWARPLQTPRAAKALWASADKIWIWAGDTATDYNRYTKRALLSGVMATTLLYWLQDASPKAAATRAFLDRRIENVLKLGSLIGRRKTA